MLLKKKDDGNEKEISFTNSKREMNEETVKK
jgi:hypothetical protein